MSQTAGPGTHPACGARQACRDPDARTAFPTTDGRTLTSSRYTEANAEQKILLQSHTSPHLRNRHRRSLSRATARTAQEAKCSEDLYSSTNHAPSRPPLPPVEKVGLVVWCKEREQNTRESVIPLLRNLQIANASGLQNRTHPLLRRRGCVNRTSHPSGSAKSRRLLRPAAWSPQQHLGTVLRRSIGHICGCQYAAPNPCGSQCGRFSCCKSRGVGIRRGLQSGLLVQSPTPLLVRRPLPTLTQSNVPRRTPPGSSVNAQNRPEPACARPP